MTFRHLDRAYILVDDDGEFYSVNFYQAWKGFMEIDLDVYRFQRKQLPILPLAPEHIVVGGIPVMREVFHLLGVQIPPNVDFPPSLIRDELLGRRFWNASLKEVRRYVRISEETPSQLPVFIKPKDSQKLFTGHWITCFADLIKTASVDPSTPLLVQDVVDFKSEWRVYVVKGKICRCCHYRGDPLMFPDGEVIQRMVTLYQESGEAPAAYGLDVGRVQDQTLLVEVNDGYALGNYGLSSIAYARLLTTRWNQVVGFE